jgi:tRNA-2-methylthio-N6-dimethylallyladenosine synthase
MAERLGNELKQKIKGVDKVIGAKSFEAFLCDLDKHVDQPDASAVDHQFSNAISTFIPIMRGCNNYCTYCIVPYVRGPEQSIPLQTIVDTTKSYIDKGVKEITLLGQNVNSYRDGTTDFPALLHALHKLKGLNRIRFTTSHPKDFSESLAKTIAELPKLCKHIHLPIQSGSDRILGLMNRNYTKKDYLDKIDFMRKYCPDADITTDAMVGFSSETDEEFNDTLSLFKTVQFTTAFMFMYSKRDNTKAATMPDDVELPVKKKRLKELIDCQTDITKQQYKAMVGKTVSVLCTEKQSGRDHMWMGQDNGFKRVLVACDRDLSGTILPVMVQRSTGMTLVASIAERVA